MLTSFLVVLLLAATPSDSAAQAFQRGEKALAEGKLEDAALAYQEALKETPKYPAALNGLGSTRFKQGQRKEALELLRQAVAADPDFALAHFNLGFVARKEGDFVQAAQAYERYVALSPADPDGYFGLGESQRGAGAVAAAAEAYERYLALEKRPTETRWVDRAKELLVELRTQLSAEVPTEAEPPMMAEPLEADVPVALEVWEDSLPATSAAPEPGLAAQRITEGDRAMREKRFRDATFAYQDAVNLDDASVEAHFKVATAQAVLGYYRHAVSHWKRATELTAHEAVRKAAHDNIERAQAKMSVAGGSPYARGQLPGTGPLASSTRVEARLAYERGVVQVKRRDYRAAHVSLSEAIQKEPDLTVAYVARGSALVGLGRYAEANADYEHAARLEPSMAAPLYGAAEALRGLGRNRDAKLMYERYAASKSTDVHPALQQEARRKAESLR